MSSTLLQKPEVGKEYIEPNEARDTQAIIDNIIKRLNRDYPPGKTLRQFHAKMHGLVKATFTVLPDIPPNFQYGFLIPGKSYETWIRFSNGSIKPADDSKKDLRGMSVKLLNVPGEMYVQDHAYPQSQDFTLVSHPTLMSPDVKSVRRNIQGVCNGTWGLILFSLNPINWATIRRNLQGQKKIDNMLSLKYYSASPFRLGKPDQAVKYAAFPVTEETGTSNKKDKNFLRKRMKDELADKAIQYDFMIQFQEDAEKMPIETVCVEWKSAWNKIAEIEIHPQTFDTPQRDTLCENMTFSPWHCHKENKPLGGINRARQATYEAVSKFRVERNTK